jgi:hypothetical protein
MVKNYSYFLITPKLANENLGRQWRPSYVTNWPNFTANVKQYSESYSKAPRNSALRNKIGANFSQAYNKWLRKTEQEHMERKRGRANEMRALLKTLGVRKNVLAGTPRPNRKSPNRSLPVARSPLTPRARHLKGAKPLNLRRALGHIAVKRNTNKLSSNINKKRNNIASASAVLRKLKGPAHNRQKALIANLEANLKKLRNLLSQAP